MTASAAANARAAAAGRRDADDRRRARRSCKVEFPDLTISKIRFLETEGLVQPERTPSGYRKFSPADVARLRYVLAQQRDHYLPLRVIKDQLDAIDRGLVPPGADGDSPRVAARGDRRDRGQRADAPSTSGPRRRRCGCRATSCSTPPACAASSSASSSSSA